VNPLLIKAVRAGLFFRWISYCYQGKRDNLLGHPEEGTHPINKGSLGTVLSRDRKESDMVID
jgi:hypothetical protein